MMNKERFLASAGLVFCLIGLVARIGNVSTLMSAIPTSDELWLGLINVAEYAIHAPLYRAGGNQLTTLWFLDFAFSIFGSSIVIARWVMAGFGLLAGLLWFRVLKLVLPPWAACMALALWLCDIQLGWFLKLSYDPGWAAAFFGIFAAAFISWRRDPSPFKLGGVAFVFVLSLFTYPAFHIAVLALSLPFILAAVIRFRHHVNDLRKLLNWQSLVAVTPAFLLLIWFLHLHFHHLTEFAGLWQAGGGWIRSWGEFKVSSEAVILDLFTEKGSSWYILHRMPFVPYGVWIIGLLAVLGGVTRRNHLALKLLMGVLLLILVSCLTTSYPGARRLIAIGYPLSLLFGLGLLEAHNFLSRWNARLAGVVVLMLMLATVGPGLSYFLTKGREIEKYNIGHGMSVIPPEPEALVEPTKWGALYFDSAELISWVDVRYVETVNVLLEKYFRNRTRLGTVQVVDFKGFRGPPLSTQYKFGFASYNSESLKVMAERFSRCKKSEEPLVFRSFLLHYLKVNCEPEPKGEDKTN